MVDVTRLEPLLVKQVLSLLSYTLTELSIKFLQGCV
jgi:hypothetical protein